MRFFEDEKLLLLFVSLVPWAAYASGNRGNSKIQKR